MTQWPIDDKHIDELRLDIKNVRIPDEEFDDSAIANYMVEAESLLDLARDILRDGYLDNELPVITFEADQWMVLEGNRRVTALKAINSPHLLGKAEPRMRRLLSRFPDHSTPEQIRVMIAPSRAAAQPLLARLHTRNPKKSWLREQQAIFYHAQLGPNVSVDDLRTLYPSEASSIASFVRMGEMRELIRSLKFNDPSLEQFVKTSQLKMTSFEYAYDLPRVQAALGLSFSKDGLLDNKRLNAGQQRGLTYLLERFRSTTAPLNTRSPELKAKSNEHEPFVEELQRVVAGRSRSKPVGPPGPAGGAGHGGNTPTNGGASGSGGPTQGSGQRDASSSQDRAAGKGDSNASENSGDAAARNDSGTGSRGANRGATRVRLDMTGFEYGLHSAGLRRRFEELKSIDVRTFPNAAHDLMRTILECAIKDYFITRGDPLTAGKMLGACIGELAKEFAQDRRMTTLINNVNRSGKMLAAQFTGTATSLNASNHEPDVFVSGPEVHEAWEKIKPILVEIVGR